MSEVKFYRCRHCGNLVAVVEDAGPVPVCCGEPMELLVAGSVDAAAEKHVPAVTREAPQLRDAQSHVTLLVRGRSFEYTARSARMPDPGQPDTSPMAQSYAAQRALPP